MASSSSRVARKAFHTAPSHVRRVQMSARLSKDLRKQYGVRAVPLRKDDEVRIMAGRHAGQTGKVSTMYRLKRVVYVDGQTVEKTNGTTQPRPIQASNVEITRIKLDSDRKALLQRRKTN